MLFLYVRFTCSRKVLAPVLQEMVVLMGALQLDNSNASLSFSERNFKLQPKSTNHQ